MQNPRGFKLTLAQNLAYQTGRRWLQNEITAGVQPENLSEVDTGAILETYYWRAAPLQPHLPQFQDGLGSVLFGLPVEGFEPIPLSALEVELDKLACHDLEDLKYFKQVFLDLQYRRELRQGLVAPHEQVVFHWLATQSRKYGEAAPQTEAYREPEIEPSLKHPQLIIHPPTDSVIPPHTWDEINALAQQVGILDSAGAYALGYQKQSAVAGFIDALRDADYLKGSNKVLHPVFSRRYQVNIKTDSVTKARREYQILTKKVIKQRAI